MDFCKERDKFCVICGDYVTVKQKKALTARVRRIYFLYFGFDLPENIPWAPSKSCSHCVYTLANWERGIGKGMKFGVPMIWRQPQNHDHSDCYFCRAMDLTGFKASDKSFIVYPTRTSAQRPIDHDDTLLPVPRSPMEMENNNVEPNHPNDEFDDEVVFPGPGGPTENDDESNDPTIEFESEEEIKKSELHKPNQSELNDLVRDLELTKEKGEILISRLKQWKLVAPKVRSSFNRHRDKTFTSFFTDHGTCVACNDVDGLLAAMGLEHNPQDWRLFLDSSKRSLKVVLLHNQNTYPSIPIAYSTTMKENYENVKMVLEHIDYYHHQWHICADLKMVAIILGLQLGFTKFTCFLCLWNSRDRRHHYVLKNWPERKHFRPGKNNVIREPLVVPSKIIIPALHIKLGAFKNWVKALDKKGPGFKYIREKFPGVSDAKANEGVFVGPQIRKLQRDEGFTEALTGIEKDSWLAFKAVAENFLGNRRADNYQELISDMLSKFKALGVLMSPKLHFLHSHVNRFPPNCGQFSDEHGEQFHQTLSKYEKRYQGKEGPRMLGDYCWNCIRENSTTELKRKTKKRKIGDD